MLETDFVASKLVTPNNHLPSSIKFIGGENEKVSICLLIMNSSVSWSFAFVCSINVSVCFFIKSNSSLFIQVIQIHQQEIFHFLWQFFVLFRRKWIFLSSVWLTISCLFSLWIAIFVYLSHTVSGSFFLSVICFKENVNIIISMVFFLNTICIQEIPWHYKTKLQI